MKHKIDNESVAAWAVIAYLVSFLSDVLTDVRSHAFTLDLIIKEHSITSDVHWGKVHRSLWNNNTNLKRRTLYILKSAWVSTFCICILNKLALQFKFEYKAACKSKQNYLITAWGKNIFCLYYNYRHFY